MKLERRILFVLAIATLLAVVYVLWPTPSWVEPAPGFSTAIHRATSSEFRLHIVASDGSYRKRD